MNDIRTLVQSKLDLIIGLDSGPAMPDGLVEKGKTYFGYELSENYRGSDFNKNYSMEITLTGRLVRKIDPVENTVQIVDSMLEDIKAVLKQINFKYSYRDVSEFQDGFRKIAVTATAAYSEINNAIIV